MTPHKLLELLKAHRESGSFNKWDYDYFDRKIKEIDFERNKDGDIAALEIRLQRLITIEDEEKLK